MNTLIDAARTTAATLTVAVNLASIAVALGAAAMAYSHNLLTGVLVALAGLISGVVGFGYSTWRIRKGRLTASHA